MTRGARFVLLLLAVACAHVPVPPAQPPSSIDLGAVLPLTGAMSVFGATTKRGLELAVDQINANGGVGGRRLQLDVRDDLSRPEDAIHALKALAQDGDIVAVIGEVSSSNTIAMAALAQHIGVPLVTPSATDPNVTRVGEYIFRACFIDPVQGSAMARYVMSRLHLRQVAVLTDTSSHYSVGLAEAFEHAFHEQLGGEIVSRETYSQGDVDFRPELKRIHDAKPEALFVPGYYSDAALIARQAREIGLNIPLLGGDGWSSAELHKIGGSAVEGSFFVDHGAPDDPTPASQAFVHDYRQRYGETPDTVAMLAYTTVQLLADALSRTKVPSRASLREALAETRACPTIGGELTLDAQRNAVKPAVIVTVGKDGQFHFVERVSP